METKPQNPSKQAPSPWDLLILGDEWWKPTNPNNPWISTSKTIIESDQENKSKGYYKPTMILAGYNFTWQLTRTMEITIIYHNHDHCQMSLCNNLNYIIPIRLMKTKYSIRAWDFLFYLFSLSSFFHLELSSHTTTTLLILVNNF